MVKLHETLLSHYQSKQDTGYACALIGSDLHTDPLFNLKYLNVMQKSKTWRRLHISDLFTQRETNIAIWLIWLLQVCKKSSFCIFQCLNIEYLNIIIENLFCMFERKEWCCCRICLGLISLYIITIYYKCNPCKLFTLILTLFILHFFTLFTYSLILKKNFVSMH